MPTRLERAAAAADAANKRLAQEVSAENRRRRKDDSAVKTRLGAELIAAVRAGYPDALALYVKLRREIDAASASTKSSRTRDRFERWDADGGHGHGLPSWATDASPAGEDPVAGSPPPAGEDVGAGSPPSAGDDLLDAPRCWLPDLSEIGLDPLEEIGGTVE